MQSLNEKYEKIKAFDQSWSVEKKQEEFEKFRNMIEMLNENSPDDVFSQYDLITSLIHYKRHKHSIKS